MKQSEKLDIILRYLYDRKDDNKEYSSADILSSSGIETNTTELARLAEDLEKDKYITLNNLSSKLKKAKIRRVVRRLQQTPICSMKRSRTTKTAISVSSRGQAPSMARKKQ